jgi:hypothetical protein
VLTREARTKGNVINPAPVPNEIVLIFSKSAVIVEAVNVRVKKLLAMLVEKEDKFDPRAAVLT